MRIVVIGSGFGGLAAAIRLQVMGHDVTIVEQRDKPGGRAYVYEQDGFTFDGGPTIITAPQLIEEIFALAGRQLSDYVQLVPVSPFYNIRFEDGSVFRYTGEQQQVESEVTRFNPNDLEGYRKFREKTADIFETGFGMIDRPFLTLGSFAKILPDLVRLRSDRSVATFVNKYMKDERLRQVFSFHPLLVGGNPFRATSIYALIHHLEQKWGVWFAMGGMGAVVRAMVQLFEERGGTIRLSTPAREILVNPATKRATGVRLDDETLEADVVISNGDVANTYMRLVPPQFREKNSDKYLAGLDYSMSLFVIYFGTNRKYDDVAHHEILLGPRYQGLLEDIFKRKVLAKDFSLYLHRPTATDPSLAPPGCDAFYVLSPVPHLGGNTDWTTAAQPYRDAIMQYLEERYLPDLRQHIVTEHRIDPLHFRDVLTSHVGSAFSVEPTLTQSAWMRPHNRSEDIPNLYFAGAGTHPGAGIPGVLSSGKTTAELIGPERGVRRGRAVEETVPR